MVLWEAFECTIMVQSCFHLKTCYLKTNKLSIPDEAVGCILSYPVLYFAIQMLSFLGGEGSSFSLEN